MSDVERSEIPRNKLLSFSGVKFAGEGSSEMYDVLKRHAVQVLHEAGISLVGIAKQVGSSKATVCRILKEPEVSSGSVGNDLQLGQKDPAGKVGRPRVGRDYAEQVSEILQAEPHLPTVEILHRVREKGYSGGKSSLYELVAHLRPRQAAPLVRFEGVAGEFSQHDFGHVRVTYLNGTSEVVHFFASRLKWSRWSHVVTVAGESVEPLVRALLLGLESFGGVPLVAVFDNPKTIVLSRDQERIEWNPTFGQVALDFRFAPELCFPARANQKGSVENLVGWVKNSFFKVRRFHDREDLERQLNEWLEEINYRRPSRATNIIPAVRMQEERQRLRALAFPATDYALRLEESFGFPVFVGPTGWVEFRNVRYSMPAPTLNMPGTLHLYADRVKIVVKDHAVEHPRIPANGRVSSHREHTAQALAQVSGKRAKLYYRRQRLLELGDPADAFLTELIHARPRTWSGDIEQLFTALQSFGAEPLLTAMQRAHARNLYGSEYVLETLQERTARP